MKITTGRGAPAPIRIPEKISEILARFRLTRYPPGGNIQIQERYERSPTMTQRINITKAQGEIIDSRYTWIWSAWLDGSLVAKGHAFKKDQAIERAQDHLDPEIATTFKITESRW